MQSEPVTKQTATTFDLYVRVCLFNRLNIELKLLTTDNAKIVVLDIITSPFLPVKYSFYYLTCICKDVCI
jgi:hypothetical protein